MPNISSKAINAVVGETPSTSAPEPQKIVNAHDTLVGAQNQKDEWVWVRIPTRDITDYPFDGVCINFLHFGPINAASRKCDCGDSPNCQTTGVHKIPAKFAPEVLDRLRIFQEQCVKVYSSRVNLKALQELAVSSPGYLNAVEEFNKSGLNQ